ncbi:ISL3 family transposase [Janibacter sp. HTCC2649]|uniref:ISL3 family transposase n=3 Tax=Janibacter sp. HTCC2649 TaxID=313589 RepID=UPI000594DB07
MGQVCGFAPSEVVVDGAELVEGVVLVRARTRFGSRQRCPHCRRRCPRYDRGRQRRWRGLDWDRRRVFVHARIPRVSCREHGVVVAWVPWARHGARHTTAFEDMAAWAATQMSITAVTTLLRCAWRTIGSIVTRVLADRRAASGSDGLDGLRRIGIDEVAYRRGRRYLVVVVDHDTGRLVWVGSRARKETVNQFFVALGPERTAHLTHVTSDSASWIASPVAEHAPKAIHCADPFHIVQWAGDALDACRRQVWNSVRIRQKRGSGAATGAGVPVKNIMWTLRMNPDRWGDQHVESMSWLAATHPDLHRAWQLKEALRAVFATGTGNDRGVTAMELLESWTAHALASQLEPFIELALKITAHRKTIDAALTSGLNNALTESANNKIRVITRRAYGFHNVDALIALAMLSLGIYRPTNPHE